MQQATLTARRGSVALPSAARRAMAPSAPRLASRWSPLVMRANEKVSLTQSVDEEASNVTGDFCSLDATGKKAPKRTVGEMEQVRRLPSAVYKSSHAPRGLGPPPRVDMARGQASPRIPGAHISTAPAIPVLCPGLGPS